MVHTLQKNTFICITKVYITEQKKINVDTFYFFFFGLFLHLPFTWIFRLMVCWKVLTGHITKDFSVQINETILSIAFFYADFYAFILFLKFIALVPVSMFVPTQFHTLCSVLLTCLEAVAQCRCLFSFRYTWKVLTILAGIVAQFPSIMLTLHGRKPLF